MGVTGHNQLWEHVWKTPNLVDDGSKLVSGLLRELGRGIISSSLQEKEIRTKEELTHALNLTFDILDLFPFNFNMLQVQRRRSGSFLPCLHSPWGSLSASSDREHGTEHAGQNSLYAIYIVPLHLGLSFRSGLPGICRIMTYPPTFGKLTWLGGCIVASFGL